MNLRYRYALLGVLVRELKKNGSWCGETHIQKATYLAKEMLGVPFTYDFILYKHGPFSFDLKCELRQMRADGMTKLCPQGPYGSSFELTHAAEKVMREHAGLVGKVSDRLAFLAQALGGKRVAQLERLATGFYVTRDITGRASATSRAERLHALKPHINLPLAVEAVREVDGLVERWRAFGMRS